MKFLVEKFLLISFLLFLPFGSTISLNSTSENNVTAKLTNSELLISGNADFHNKAEIWGWSGTGEESNPYIIENLILKGPINAIRWPKHLIKIENVNLHFIIQNCSFSNIDKDGCGIFLNRVSHAIIKQNFFKNNSKGIDLEYCTDIAITNNYLFNNSNGIYVGYSHASYTINICNNIFNLSEGIHLYYSTGIVVDENVIKNSGDLNEGISLSCSNENIITDNVLINSTIFFSGDVDDGYGNPSGEEKDTLQTLIKGNSVNGKPLIYYQEKDGILFKEEDVGKVIFNACNNVQLIDQQPTNTHTQFDFIRCMDVSISNCSFSQLSEVPIQIRYTNYFKLTNNIFSNCSSAGVRLYDTSFGRIIENKFVSNHRGISAYSAFYNVFSGNYFFKNFYGISLHTCYSNQIYKSSFSDNDVGLRILSSDNTTIISNVFVNNTSAGIYGGHVTRWINITTNVISSTGLKGNGTWKGIGIYLWNTYNGLISKNNITNNRNFGVFLDCCKNTLVIYNNFIDNNINGTSQAGDYWIVWGDIWKYSYDNFTHNYWSDWNGIGSYQIGHYMTEERGGEIIYGDDHPSESPYPNTFINITDDSIPVYTTSNINFREISLILTLSLLVILVSLGLFGYIKRIKT